jgi:hypothetical protein
MTVTEAVRAIRQVGTVEICDGRLRLRIPKTALTSMQQAIETLQNQKTEAMALLAIEPDAEPSREDAEALCPEVALATVVLNQAGVRLMRLECGDTVGIWSDLDSPAIRNALAILGVDQLPVLYLDGPSVPVAQKLRRPPGDPVPANVRIAMEQANERSRQRAHTQLSSL